MSLSELAFSKLWEILTPDIQKEFVLKHKEELMEMLGAELDPRRRFNQILIMLNLPLILFVDNSPIYFNSDRMSALIPSPNCFRVTLSGLQVSIDNKFGIKTLVTWAQTPAFLKSIQDGSYKTMLKQLTGE